MVSISSRRYDSSIINLSLRCRQLLSSTVLLSSHIQRFRLGFIIMVILLACFAGLIWLIFLDEAIFDLHVFLQFVGRFVCEIYYLFLILDLRADILLRASNLAFWVLAFFSSSFNFLSLASSDPLRIMTVSDFWIYFSEFYFGGLPRVFAIFRVFDEIV